MLRSLITYTLSLGRTAFFVGVLTLLTSAQSLTVTYSKKNFMDKYSPSSIILLAELFKLGFSVFAFVSEKKEKAGMSAEQSDLEERGVGRSKPEPSVLVRLLTPTTFWYAPPALFYFVMNSLTFYCLAYVDPATYVVFMNLKIISTGVLFRVFLQRPLSGIQWASLCVMTIGAAVSQLPTDGSTSFSINFTGLVLMTAQVTLSGVSATYLEWIVKREFKESINFQNMKMYIFGCLLSVVTMFGFDRSGFDIFAGHSRVSVLIILILAFQGLVTSWVMKYSDSIVKVYAAAVAMFLTSAASSFLFGTQLSNQFYLGAMNCSVALYLHSAKAPAAPAPATKPEPPPPVTNKADD
eukprot:TRINITY_DN6553_c0_g1_i2.p1 TRINITY_DN6553_c0_g1~~TRINITY_DN6553_c0_g1_i2.p1  ORF type:complete len:352 (+),score=160.15 TRINITY_DN6553_c0_g1_i2:126-1181(+)